MNETNILKPGRIFIALMIFVFLGFSAEGSERVAVTFTVTVPDSTPDNADLYIVGNVDELGQWQHKAVLPRVALRQFRKTFYIEEGLNIEYKYTLGEWSMVEKTATGAEISNRIQKIIKGLNVKDTIAGWSGNSTAGSTATGNIRTISNYYSPELNNSRNIKVYLPSGYASKRFKRYPVIYMHDGNNIFDSATAFGGNEWMADEHAEDLIDSARVRPFIIVGIYNTADRLNEYTPFYDPEVNAGGKGDLYLKFIVNTLKPFIDKTYRTLPDREHTTIAGSSLGGLISLYAAFKHSDVFGAAAAISPSIWWSSRQILDYVNERPISLNIRLWLDIGSAEGEVLPDSSITGAVQNCRDLAIALRKMQSSGAPVVFSYREFDGAGHNEYFWSLRMADVFKYFYSPRAKNVRE